LLISQAFHPCLGCAANWWHSVIYALFCAHSMNAFLETACNTSERKHFHNLAPLQNREADSKILAVAQND
jgi:hypothetical protein